ncbi:MAG: ligase-associated DNA damage response endonuclease PdeM [Planctomycetota bacterium]
MIIEHKAHRLELFPSGAIGWGKTLLVADLHLGKETVFQKSGLAIPSGATRRTLERLLEHLERGRVERLVVLGDLLHAPAGWTGELEQLLSEAKRTFPDVHWELVAGNHDRRSHEQLREIGWLVQNPPVLDGKMLYLHEPPLEMPCRNDAQGADLTLCGHLHPSYKVPLDALQRAKVPCFWIRPESIVLPAFGGWVGTHAIEPCRSDRIVLCVEGQLIEWKH